MQATTPRAFSADTEILTRRGWVTFDQLTYMDEVATRTPDGRFEWHHPERITWQHYDGDMIWFHSRTANLLAGPETPILHMFRPRATANGKRYELPAVERTRPAGSLVSWDGPLVATSTWNPTSVKNEFTFKPKPVRLDGKRNLGKPPLSFTASAADFAALMGMWLAEGNLNSSGNGRYGIQISQNYMGRGYREFQDLLNRLCGRPVPWREPGNWMFSNKGLFEYLKACGVYAWTKIIPPEIPGLPGEHLEQFWHYYWLGDGTTMVSPGRKPVEVISTTSKIMADQFQEILQKLGGWALIQVIDGSKYPSKLGKTTRLTYRLVRRAGATAYASHVQRIPYSGMIGNAETGTGPVYVRRSGRPTWAGLQHIRPARRCRESHLRGSGCNEGGARRCAPHPCSAVRRLGGDQLRSRPTPCTGTRTRTPTARSCRGPPGRSPTARSGR